MKMRIVSGLLAIGLGTTVWAAPTADICVVVGAHGENDFAAGFTTAALAWEQAAKRGGANYTVIGLESGANDGADKADGATTSVSSEPRNGGHGGRSSVTERSGSMGEREQLKQWLSERAADDKTPLWIVYVGHGTFDGREARLNLRGPDLTAKELATWLEPLRRPVVFIHGGSAAAPFIPALSAPGRIIITATRSGNELNYARFGERFAEAVANPNADVDQDGQTSLLEAFVTAAQRVQAFYAESGRLATEHALIDDNGDKQGTPADWFRGNRLQRRAKGSAEPDGGRAKLIALVPSETERALTPVQRERRDQLERELEALRARKSDLKEDDYYRQLEMIVRQIGEIYRRDS